MGKFKDIWDRDKDGSNHGQRSFIRYAIVATVVFAVFLLVKKDSVIRWVQAGFTLRRQEQQQGKEQEPGPSHQVSPSVSRSFCCRLILTSCTSRGSCPRWMSA